MYSNHNRANFQVHHLRSVCAWPFSFWIKCL